MSQYGDNQEVALGDRVRTATYEAIIVKLPGEGETAVRVAYLRSRGVVTNAQVLSRRPWLASECQLSVDQIDVDPADLTLLARDEV